LKFVLVEVFVKNQNLLQNLNFFLKNKNVGKILLFGPYNLRFRKNPNLKKNSKKPNFEKKKISKKKQFEKNQIWKKNSKKKQFEKNQISKTNKISKKPKFGKKTQN